ncbi:MAG: ATP-binding cassette domain-containing protein [Candidatus Marinimicrobia bacterium]|nr:ATP-binding cassette domain-containing protein [Candidatus Neomarinimicrobiota bacterium]
MNNYKNSVIVKNMSKAFGQLQAVDNISFHVHKGEIFGFLGPNGAGKTTSVRMLTGVFPPDTGQIYIAGYNLLDQTLAAKMRIGVAPESANAYLDLTALENILFMAEMYGLSGKKIRKRAEELLNIFNLLDRKNDKIKQFSKGMRQKMILCMALINEPEILFLDEPTSGLDVQSRYLIRNIIKDLNQGGTTIFLTTHNINEANKLCDRIAIMNKGEIAAIDSPENLKNTFVSSQSVEVSFKFGSPNFLDNLSYANSIEKRGDKYRLYSDEPGQLAMKLIEQVKSSNLGLNSIRTIGPELEEVFIKLTEEKKE